MMIWLINANLATEYKLLERIDAYLAKGEVTRLEYLGKLKVVNILGLKELDYF